MMGPYYYYDTSPIEDVSAEFHIHDCMWSGECYSCQPARVTFSNATSAPQSAQPPPPLPGTHGTVPITVGGQATGGYITLTATTRQETPSKRLVWPERPTRIKPENKSHEDEVDSFKSSSSDSTPGCSPRMQSVEKKSSASTVTNNCKVNSKRANKKGNHSSSTDNKKLRHREVEKNRHRQLQAMVKTLSEKIPGRLDKETQVQTMKRAARYCVYLRDVVNILSHHGQSATLKEKLEKLYLKSCDYVHGVHSD